MGFQLVAQTVLYAWPTIPQQHSGAARVLAVMAHHAKDTDSNPTYFAGSSHLVRSLGYPIESEAGERAVRRAIAHLVHLGYVKQLEGTPRHWKRRWQLRLPGPGP